MNTPIENAREDYYSKHGHYPENEIKEHPCYYCKHFNDCDTEIWARCDDYEEEE